MGAEYSGANDFGVRIAVESEGRFFAISDSNKRVRILAFGSEENEGLMNASPDLQSRHTISIENGVILNMAFLTSTGSSNVNSGVNSSVSSPRIESLGTAGKPLGDVYLVILYAVARKLKLNMYKVPYGQKEYIHDTGLCGTFTLSLDYADEIPLYMVPIAVKDSSAIVLVTRDQFMLVTFLDIMSGHRLLTSFSLPGFPLAIHQSPFDNNKGIFYFTTESGSLYQVKVSEKRGFELLLLVDLSRDLGSSFVLQPYDDDFGVVENSTVNESDRLLMTYGGDLCTGGSIVFNSIEYMEEEGSDIQEIEIFDNWAPISDFKALNIHSASKGDSLELFACTGLNDTGAITQFRHGFRASVFLQGPSMKEAPNLYSLKSYEGDCYLVVSLPWKTTLYLVTSEKEEGEGDDDFPQLCEVPNNCGIDCNSETKAISFLAESKLVVQITTSQIILTNLSGFSVNYSIPNIGSATILGGLLAIAFYDETIASNRVNVYMIDETRVNSENESERENWIQKLVDPITCPQPISFIKFINANNDINLFVGSYEPSISMYRVTIDIQDISLLTEIKDIFDSEEVPNDIYFQQIDAPSYVIGLRNGTYMHCVWDKRDTNKFAIENRRKLGNLPINFISIDNRDDGDELLDAPIKTILLSNGKLACFDNKNLSDAPQRVIIDTDKVTEIKSACQFFSQIDDGKHQFIAVIMNNRLMILVLDTFATIIPKQVRLGLTPRRLLYIDHICAFAVIVSPKEGKSLLRFVDPKRMVEVSWTLADDATGKLPFLPNEFVFSLCEWSLELEGKLYKYLVVGSGIQGISEGRIRILRLSRSNTGIKVNVQYYWKTDGPVYAISQFKNL